MMLCLHGSGPPLFCRFRLHLLAAGRHQLRVGRPNLAEIVRVLSTSTRALHSLHERDAGLFHPESRRCRLRLAEFHCPQHYRMEGIRYVGREAGEYHRVNLSLASTRTTPLAVLQGELSPHMADGESLLEESAFSAECACR